MSNLENCFKSLDVLVKVGTSQTKASGSVIDVISSNLEQQTCELCNEGNMSRDTVQEVLSNRLLLEINQDKILLPRCQSYVDRCCVRCSYLRLYSYLIQLIKLNLKTIDISLSNGTALSLQQMSVLRKSIEFFIAIGIWPNLMTGIGIPIEKRSDHADFLMKEMKCPEEDLDFKKYQQLKDVIFIVLDVLDCGDIGSLFLKNHLLDVLSALIQICHAPLSKPVSIDTKPETSQTFIMTEKVHQNLMEDRKKFLPKLKSIVDHSDTSLVLRNLLILLGPSSTPPTCKKFFYRTPVWVKKCCMSYILAILEKPDGFISLSTNLLDTIKDDPIQERTAIELISNLVLAHPALKTKPSKYLTCICKQMLSILKMAGDDIRPYQNMIASVIDKLLQQHEDHLQTYFYNPLLSPVICMQCDKLSCHLGMIHNFIFTPIYMSTVLLSKLGVVIPPLIHLYCGLINSVSPAKSVIKSILLQYFSNQDIPDCITALSTFFTSPEFETYYAHTHFKLNDEAKLIVFKCDNKTHCEYQKGVGEKVMCVIPLISENCRDDFLQQYFVSVYSTMIRLLFDQTKTHEYDSLSVVSCILDNLCDSQQCIEALLKNWKLIFNMIEDTVDLIAGVNGNLESRAVNVREYLSFFLTVLNVMLGQDQVKLERDDLMRLHTKLKHLSKLGFQEVHEANLLIDSYLECHKDGNVEADPPVSISRLPYDSALREATSDDISLCGHGLLSLTKQLVSRQKDAIKNKDLLLVLFLEKLQHEDSYVYLMSIQGLVALVDKFPDKLIPIIIEEYTQPTNKTTCCETRIKVGEALVRICRLLGDLSPAYKHLLVSAFLKGIRDSDPLIRASSLTNLGEACKALKFSMSFAACEIVHCIQCLISTEKEVEVRRAALMLLRTLLEGLGKDCLAILSDHMRDIFRVVRDGYRREVDDQCRLHAQLAIEEINDIMKTSLLPTQSLVKEIKVLNLK